MIRVAVACSGKGTGKNGFTQPEYRADHPSNQLRQTPNRKYSGQGGALGLLTQGKS